MFELFCLINNFMIWKRKKKERKKRYDWWWWQDSNPETMDCETRALPLSYQNQLQLYSLQNHWPQYMDSWLARFCILVNACHRKSLGSHFTPVKTLDRHIFCTCQCMMKCNRLQVFSFKFHENSEKKWKSFPRSSRLLNIYWKLLKKIADVN